jgi:hypothetical protein
MDCNSRAELYTSSLIFVGTIISLDGGERLGWHNDDGASVARKLLESLGGPLSTMNVAARLTSFGGIAFSG